MRHATKVRWALLVTGPSLAAIVLFGSWIVAAATGGPS